MISFTSEFQAELERGDPNVLLDVYEFYSSDYVPTATGFDPNDAIEHFAAQEIDWNGNTYRREAVSRSDITLTISEKTNSVSMVFSNISRYMATLAENQQIEGLLLVIRCIAPNVTNDSRVLFHGRCNKPGDIDKKRFSLSAEQYLGNINQTLPPREFTAVDPEGRLPSDPLFEGINFLAVGGTLTYGGSPGRSGSILGAILGGVVGFLLGRRSSTPATTKQWSSVDSTPYGQKIREVFGRVQLQGRAFAQADKGTFVSYLMEFCAGPIFAIENVKSRTEGFSDPVNSLAVPPAPVIIHLGDPGGTGTNMGNVGQADLGGGVFFSHLAYIEGASTGSSLDATDGPPVITALVFGRIVPLPDGLGAYVEEGWTDNPAHILRFILTHPKFINIDPAFMDDAAFVRLAEHCAAPLIDDTNDEMIVIHLDDIPDAGSGFTRYPSTGLITPRSILYRNLGDTTILPELVDGPYVPWDPTDPVPPGLPGATPTFTRQRVLRPRYTANFPITEEIRGTDLIHKILLPTCKGWMRVNHLGLIEPRSEMPSDATRIRSSTTVGATSIPVLDVTPWKTGPELLTGKVLIGLSLITSEARKVSSAVYSTSGNAVSFVASAGGGGVSAKASGANLSGGSTTVQASGTVTIGGTPAAGNTVTITIDGIAVEYTLGAEDTTSTVAVMMKHLINATPRLRTYILASWDSGSPTVITIKCLHGALNLTTALLKTHSGPISDPGTAPTVAATGSGSLAAGIYYLAYANALGVGLTALTPVANVTLTASQKISITGLPAFPAGVTEREFYLSEETGSQNLRYVVTRSDVSNFTIDDLPEPGANLPPSVNTTAEELIRGESYATNSQDIFSAWQPSTLIVLNEIRLPFPLNDHKYEATSITTGITAATPPTFPTSAGGTVVDGGVTWTEIGSTVLAQAGLSRANIVAETFSFPGGSTQPSINQLKGWYISAKDDFARSPFKINDKPHQLQVKKELPKEVDYTAVDSWHQVSRLGNGELSKNREGDWFATWTAGPSALTHEEGDVAFVSDDSGGLINVAVRAEEIRIKPNHHVQFAQARKYSTTMFSDDVGSHRIVIPSTLKLSKPRSISNLLVIWQGDGDWFTQFTLNSPNDPREGIVDIYSLDGLTLKRTLRAIETRAVAVPLEDAGSVDPYADLYDPNVKLPPIATVTTYADKNNLIAPTSSTIAYVKSVLAIESTGVRIDVTTDVPRDGSGDEVPDDNFGSFFGLISAAATGVPPSSVDIPFQVGWFAPDSPGDSTERYIRVLNYATNVYEEFSVGMGSPSNVRAGETFSIMLSGSECRIYRNYQEGGTPLVVMNLSDDMFPLRIFASASNGSDMLNFTIRGLTATTVYSVRQQEEDFGSAQTQIRMKVRQRSRLDSIRGIETDYTTP